MTTTFHDLVGATAPAVDAVHGDALAAQLRGLTPSLAVVETACDASQARGTLLDDRCIAGETASASAGTGAIPFCIADETASASAGTGAIPFCIEGEAASASAGTGVIPYCISDEATDASAGAASPGVICISDAAAVASENLAS